MPDYDWNAYGNDLVKAAMPDSISALDVGDAARPPKTLLYDPFQLVELLGWKERPTGLAYTMLDNMVRRTPPIQAMIQTRLSQVARHCRVQENSHGIGFRVQHRDKKTNLSRAARRKAESIQQAILTTTTQDAGIGRDNFEMFSRKAIYDSLVFDQACWEIVPSKKGKPHSWQVADAKTIRLADTDELFLTRKSDRAIRTVQILDGQVINEYPAREMAWMIRNPRSSIQAQGYGTSELEMLVHVITAMLWAFQYNQKFFSQGSTPKGMINFKGQLPGRQLAAFRRFFYQMLAGVENAWRTPVVNAEQGVEWISMQESNRDMEFSQWYDFLLKLSGGMYLMDTAEIGFKYGNENDRSLFESGNEQKITVSKDKGLKPLLVTYENSLNRTIVQELDPDFELRFMGLESLTEKEQAELEKTQGETFLLIDEIREKHGRKPLANGEGQVLNSPTWMQNHQAIMQAQMQADAAAQGAPGEDAGDGAPGGDDDLESVLRGMGGQDPQGAPPSGAPSAPPRKSGTATLQKAITTYSL
jgi:hypothetical protein